MPRLKAQTDDGQVLHVHIPQFLAWVMGMSAVAITSAVGLLLNLNLRVSAIEQTRFTARDADALVQQFVPRRELETRWENVQRQLDAISQDVREIRDAVRR